MDKKAFRQICMNKLKQEALQSTKFRGHVMNEWEEGTHTWSDYARCECIKCGMDVQVETTPAPNSIDIGGTALALSCED